MNSEALNHEFKGMDLSLLDQVLKGRFTPGSKLLDAGFGGGRNSYWFLNNGFEVHGIDAKAKAVQLVHQTLQGMGKATGNFVLGELEQLPYANATFNGIICNAVLHFAQSEPHFFNLFAELVRVLAPGGILFIRMTSNIGIEHLLGESNNGVYRLPDGSDRFLLTREMLNTVVAQHQLQFVEQLKTVNVNDVRCMSTLVLTK